MLTQSEADALFAMPKKPKVNDSALFPDAGGKLLAEFVSLDGREVFLFNINRASIAVSKCTYQKRARQVEILRRLDLGGKWNFLNISAVKLLLLNMETADETIEQEV